MPTIVGEPYVTYSIAKRAFRLIRMLVDSCLMLVDVAQKDEEITDNLSMCCVMQTLRQWVRDAHGCARGCGPLIGGRHSGRRGRGRHFGLVQGDFQADA